MYAMLRVVAIVVLVSTIAGAVKVKNFTERTYSSLKLIDANQKITAEVTNAEHETQFTIEDQPQPTDQEDHGTVFRNDLDFRRNNDASLRIKLNIEEEQVYYHPIYFGIVVKNNLKKCGPCIPIFKKKDLLILALLLKPSNQDAHITLEMPVFMVPEKQLAMLWVMAIFFLVAKTVDCVEVKKFREEDYLASHRIDPAQKIAIELINADQEAHLKSMDVVMDNAATFETDLDNALNYDLDLEMKINNVLVVHFDIVFLGVMIVENPKKSILRIPRISKKQVTLSLHLLLKTDMKNLIMLEIPVFMVPDKISKVQDISLMFRKSAAGHRVGVISPMLQSALETALETGKISLNFVWLKELLSYNIYPSTMRHHVNGQDAVSFITRPLVITDDTKKVLIKIVDKFNSEKGPVV